MPRKNIINEEKSMETIAEKEQEEVIEQPKLKKKKAHQVVLIGKTRVVYKVSDKLGNSTTPLLEVWNGKLKVGDTIYLDEE
jgi:hypothetical protein